jgi:hypothetical protein
MGNKKCTLPELKCITSYTYEYNADGYPVTFTSTSEFSTRVPQYEYQVNSPLF